MKDPSHILPVTILLTIFHRKVVSLFLSCFDFYCAWDNNLISREYDATQTKHLVNGADIEDFTDR